MTLLNRIESTLKQISDVQLKQLMILWGLDLKVFDQIEDVYSRVYGTSSGRRKTGKDFNIVRGITIGDDFFPSGPFSSGTFQEGWLYTEDLDKIKPGQFVDVPSLDGKSRRYHVKSLHDIGTTQSVFARYKLIAVGD